MFKLKVQNKWFLHQFVLKHNLVRFVFVNHFQVILKLLFCFHVGKIRVFLDREKLVSRLVICFVNFLVKNSIVFYSFSQRKRNLPNVSKNNRQITNYFFQRKFLLLRHSQIVDCTSVGKTNLCMVSKHCSQHKYHIN